MKGVVVCLLRRGWSGRRDFPFLPSARSADTTLLPSAHSADATLLSSARSADATLLPSARSADATRFCGGALGAQVPGAELVAALVFFEEGLAEAVGQGVHGGAVRGLLDLQDEFSDIVGEFVATIGPGQSGSSFAPGKFKDGLILIFLEVGLVLEGGDGVVAAGMVDGVLETGDVLAEAVEEALAGLEFGGGIAVPAEEEAGITGGEEAGQTIHDEGAGAVGGVEGFAQAGGVLGIVEEFLAELPLAEGAEAVFAQVLFADGLAVEFAFKEFANGGEGVEPAEEGGAGFVFEEAEVELGLDFDWEP